ncbi:hypothetical protein MMC22_006291 [Lobaria immixta]|nr:hypothetical protein [Lobaria immixta]
MSSRGQVTAQSTKRFSKEDLETIKSLENEQSEFQKLVATSNDYSVREKEVVGYETVAQFNAYWRKTTNANQEFDQSHTKGCGLFSKKYQSSAVVVQSFIQDFSPIIEIVKNFAAPYGGMALGTISVFFTVAGNKDKMEEGLASAISAIKDRLPGLNMYQHIYNGEDELDKRLQDRIVSAYKSFVEFCIEATKYYKGGGPSLVDRVKNLEDQLLTAKDDYMLIEIQGLLSLSGYSEETQRKELEKYSEALDSDEQLNADYFEQMRGQRLDSFKACEEYKSWIESEHSCLLILSGKNNETLVRSDRFWLSPVAMAMIAGFGLPPSQLMSYYVFPPKGELLYRSFSVILLQLLRQKSQVLRKKSQTNELRAELYELQEHEHGDKKAMKKKDERLSAFQKVALRVIGFFDETETVYVILDRADRCCDWKELDHRKPLLKVLVKMVEAARCKLRVLVVINGSQWNVEKRRDELGEKIKGRVILYTAEQKYSAWKR